MPLVQNEFQIAIISVVCLKQKFDSLTKIINEILWKTLNKSGTVLSCKISTSSKMNLVLHFADHQSVCRELSCSLWKLVYEKKISDFVSHNEKSELHPHEKTLSVNYQYNREFFVRIEKQASTKMKEYFWED